VLFQVSSGVITFVLTGSESPISFLADIAKVYEVPFFKPVISAGLYAKLRLSEPKVITYSVT